MVMLEFGLAVSDELGITAQGLKTIENVKTQKEDYTNEDIYEALDSLGEYYIMWLGNLDTYEY